MLNFNFKILKKEAKNLLKQEFLRKIVYPILENVCYLK